MLIDSHAHLDMKDFDKDREKVLDRAKKGGLTHIVSVGIDLDSSLFALELARKHDFIYSTIGYHPHNADECNPKVLDELAAMASERKVVAWGEIGLDFYRSYSSREGQINMFIRQLEMADAVNLPVIIHDREAHNAIHKILRNRGKGERRGVIHCFSGDRDLAMALINLGYFISIPGTVTYKKAAQIKEVVAALPLACILIETDAPFLAPIPRRGKRNEPLFVTYTAKKIARIKGIAFERVAMQTSKNAKILFDLP